MWDLIYIDIAYCYENSIEYINYDNYNGCDWIQVDHLRNYTHASLCHILVF